MGDIEKLYSNRFSKSELEKKSEVWKVLVQAFFQRYVRKTDAVLDIAAGDCEFINRIECGRKYALDLNPKVLEKSGKGINARVGSCTDLGMYKRDYFDVVFASNIFEHLESKKEVFETLRQIRRVLKVGGKLLILQPNIRYAYREYWDFFDHNIPLSHSSMLEALAGADFRLSEARPRFLPYSTKQRRLLHPFLVWLYLKSSLLQGIFGKQMFIVAKKGHVPPEDG